MDIRKARMEDMPALCRCCAAAFSDYIPLIGRTPGPMLEDYCQARLDHHLFVGMKGETLLGFVLIKEGADDWMWLDVLAVTPHTQRHGLGRALLAFAEEAIRALGKSECRLYTHVRYRRALDLYLKNGYTIYDRVQEMGFDRYYLRRRLDAPA